MSKIVIADLGTGNLHSVCKAVEHVSEGNHVSVTNDADTIRQAEYLILPGQGAIGTWFDQLQSNSELEQAVNTRIHDGPCLGICLGLQALFSESEENGGTRGLGVMQGSVKHFSSHREHLPSKNTSSTRSPDRAQLKIPHMGWNQVRQTQQHPLWHNIADGERFYFVHSYYVDSTADSEVAGQCHYGNLFTAAATRKNVFATQFHPEKSHRAGLQLLKNFVTWNGDI